MRKFYYYLLLAFIITGCDNKEELSSKNQYSKNPTQTYIINGDIEYVSEITDGSKPTKTKFINDETSKPFEVKTNKDITTKTSEQTTKIDFHYGVSGSTNSGCIIERYNNGNSYTTDNGVYGYNPYLHKSGYLVRGAGLPHHNISYGSLVMACSNRGHQASSRGQVYNDNTSHGSAISIEFPFKENKTYEISLTTYFNDNRPIVDNVHSDGFPTLSAQLTDSGIIMEGPVACEKNYLIRLLVSNPNNIKTYTLENNIKEDKIVVFKFSLTEAKKALLIALNPKTGERGIDAKIPTNSYTMLLANVTITEKEFDPSLIIPVTPRQIEPYGGGSGRR